MGCAVNHWQRTGRYQGRLGARAGTQQCTILLHQPRNLGHVKNVSQDAITHVHTCTPHARSPVGLCRCRAAAQSSAQPRLQTGGADMTGMHVKCKMLR